MKKFFFRFFAVVGALVVVALLVGAVFALAGTALRPGVPDRVLLEVDLERPVVEDKPDDPVASAILGDAAPLRDLIEGLEVAAKDERVGALVARLGATDMGMATAQELRDAVLAFRAGGKKAIAWAETFGEFGPGNTAYYLATAFDEIYLLPSGDVGLTGVILESPFLAGTLEKVGLVPRMGQRHEYKNAMNIFTEREFTAAHEEAMRGIASAWHRQLLEGIAAGRGKSAEEARALVDRGPFLGAEALEAGLVDGMAYRDEVYEKAEAAAGASAERLSLAKYLERAGRPHEKGTAIALVYGVGGVARGKSDFNPLTGQFTMGSDTVARALRDAVEDDEVKAILFRVDSPGGSYVASDAIWRETERARAAGKPLVVSMGDVAGSGGYFVAMAADKIVAQPGTITGSIGVLGGKFLTQGMWSKLGVSWDEVHEGAAATLWTGLADYDPAQWQRFQAWLDRVYDDFTAKVAKGRNLPRETVFEIAKGRIWSGADAHRLGLVDALGGMDVALRLAREQAGIAPDAAIELKRFPKRKTPLQALLAQLGNGNETATVALVEALETVRPLARLAARLGVTGEPRDALALPASALDEPR
ncbi:MAG: signal peptide peptidase SppA [Thermoanaerobaculia bacterium]|nr:MAG: signal peptide peptidase SppA [Thermoanaerobaculia bacterium]